MSARGAADFAVCGKDSPDRSIRTSRDGWPAARELGLEHVVITSVTRDDLPDGGAEQFCQTVAEVRRSTGATIEILPSDFAGNAAAVDRLVATAPEVYNYNTETVPRLYPSVRKKGVRTIFAENSSDPFSRALSHAFPDYAWTLEMFRRIHRRDPRIALKTGLMLGLGETRDELLDALAELFEAGCRLLTLGQYLQPSPAQMPVVRYLPPEEFEELGRLCGRLVSSRWPVVPLCDRATTPEKC